MIVEAKIGFFKNLLNGKRTRKRRSRVTQLKSQLEHRVKIESKYERILHDILFSKNEGKTFSIVVLNNVRSEH